MPNMEEACYDGQYGNKYKQKPVDVRLVKAGKFQ